MRLKVLSREWATDKSEQPLNERTHEHTHTHTNVRTYECMFVCTYTNSHIHACIHIYNVTNTSSNGDRRSHTDSEIRCQWHRGDNGMTVSMPHQGHDMFTRRDLTMSFNSSRPNASTMALGGVLTGRM